MEDKFTSNAEELRKIIKENIWFGSKDEAFEFLDAVIENHKQVTEFPATELQKLKEENSELEERIEFLEMCTIDPDNYTTEILPFGEFEYKHKGLNLAFLNKLEEFIKQFKPVK
jgi:hypothetical protein